MKRTNNMSDINPINNLLKVLEDFNSLDSVGKQRVIIASLANGDLRFDDLSKAYVEFLERKDADNSRKINKAVLWLTSYWQGGKLAKSDFVKAGAAYFIVKNGYMKGAGIEQKMKDFLNEHQYEEDDNGMPKTDLKI